MPITGTNPITIPSKTFSDYWITELHVNSDIPSGKSQASVTLRPFAVEEDGSITFGATEPIVMTIPDLFGAAANNSDVAAAMSAIYAAVQSLAQVQGLI